jgi:glycosyltransferase involved in cell wall biosynthesis
MIHACYRDSVAGSAVVATSVAIHRLARSHHRVQLFVAVSEFVRDRHIAAGLVPPERMVVKPNFAWPAPRREGPGDRFLFVGRLSPEKGVATLVDAWRGGAPGRLAVVGDGPERVDLERRAPDSVEFLGPVPGEHVAGLIRDARALLLPSIWYEAQPRVIPEAYAAGVPVIASRIGGLPDQVVDAETGILVTPGDADTWGAALTRLMDDGESARMGDAAYRRWVSTYSPERSLASLEGAYALARSRGDR